MTGVSSEESAAWEIPVTRALVHLEDEIAPVPPAPGSALLQEWRVPPPTVQCFLAAHPRLPRDAWEKCVLPFVPGPMACHWMTHGLKKVKEMDHGQ